MGNLKYRGNSRAFSHHVSRADPGNDATVLAALETTPCNYVEVQWKNQYKKEHQIDRESAE